MLRFATKSRRRATIMLLVVSLLALLFVIVTSYLSVARNGRAVLGTIRTGARIEEVVHAVNEMVIGQMTAQFADGDGVPFGGAPGTRYSLEDIPGYRGTRWLAGSAPVYDWSATASLAIDSAIADLDAVRYSAVTSLDPSLGIVAAAAPPTGETVTNASIRSLMLESALDNNRQFEVGDVLVNSRRGFMDADGDGIADSSFLGSAPANELANAIAGVYVRARDLRFEPSLGAAPFYLQTSAIPGPAAAGARGLLRNAWDRYDDIARYETAVRVVSDGGLVSIAVIDPDGKAGSSVKAWNLDFTLRMWDWVNNGLGGTPMYPDTGGNAERLMHEVAARSAEVESYLRRRNGLPPWRSSTRQNATDYMVRVSDFIRNDLEKPFWKLLVPTSPNREVDGDSTNYDWWQRFKLGADGQADAIEWKAWLESAVLQPADVDPASGRIRTDFNRRVFLTAESYSDDLARKLSKYTPPAPTDPNPPPQTVPGQLKFYLGDIAEAFRADGTFEVTGGKGPRIVRRLADYYMDMLGGRDDSNVVESSKVNLPYNNRAQAFMLAVNTVAFAAPRNPTTGFIDTVYAADRGNLYVGYAPQPYITQVLVHNEDDTPGNISVAVELYNPNDAEDPTSLTDLFALDLGQFALSFKNTDLRGTSAAAERGVSWNTLDVLCGVPRLPGRNFVTLAFNGGAYLGSTFIAASLTGNIVDASGTSDVQVALWRSGAAGWVKVDEFAEIDVGKDDDSSWTECRYRDTSGAPYLSPMTTPAAPDPYWRVVRAHEMKDDTPGPSSLNPPGLAASVGPFTYPAGDVPGPFTPLYIMNAGAGFTPVWGVDRPSSFPTVGFMLMVPRYAHVLSRGEWDFAGKWIAADKAAFPYPADMGHMPIFDNTQVLKTGSYFADSNAGKIPWGQLVFDYFTTVNPRGPDDIAGTKDDVDPYRIPGRININTAPWYILSGLPVLGTNRSDLPLSAAASPAFRKYANGIFVGQGAAGVERFDASLLAENGTRLGPGLALSAAAYRDRLKYVDSSAAPAQFRLYEDSYLRPLYRDTVRYGTVRAGSTTAPDIGFLTIGELANVKGFDQSTDFSGGGVSVPPPNMTLTQGDFIKSISILMLLDSHYLTTRSNTFTVYTTVMDRENRQASVRSQMTIDRSNLLPRAKFTKDASGNPVYVGTEYPTGRPIVVAERFGGYFAAQFDD